jgi:citrate synthase
LTSSDKVRIEFGDVSAEFGVIPATEGAPGLDISRLMANMGLSAYDQGFVNTSATKSAITFIDGDNGILRHRGYPITELAGSKSFLDVSYLLVHGELPNEDEAQAFDSAIRRHTLLHEDLKDFFRSFPQSAHPMAVISSGVSALSTFYPDSLDPKDPDQVELSSIRLLAKMPVLAAYAYKTSLG